MSKGFPRIIHISDLHISDSDEQLDWQGWGKSPLVHHNTTDRLKKINEFFDQSFSKLNAPIIIHTGDLTDSGDNKDYQKARDQFLAHYKNHPHYTLYNVPGSHDYFRFGINEYLVPESVKEDDGSNRTRREKFFDYVTQYDNYPHIIPVNGDPEIGWIVLLDSMKDIVPAKAPLIPFFQDSHGTKARGKLGHAQLKALLDFLTDFDTQQKRAKGARILVALHNSPFHAFHGSEENEDGGLEDAAEFLEIVKGRIDCLLFGHITQDGKLSEGGNEEFDDKQKEWKISLISCVNLQWMDLPPEGDVVVLDIENNLREIYTTAGNKKGISYGTYPVKPRTYPHPQVIGCYRVDSSIQIDETTGHKKGYYQTYVVAMSRELTQPITYSFLLDSDSFYDVESQVIDSDGFTIPAQDFKIFLHPDNSGSFVYEHEVKIIAKDHLNSAETVLSITLPRPSVTFTKQYELKKNNAVSLTPSGIQIQPDGIILKFPDLPKLPIATVTIKADCSHLVGKLAFKWNPVPESGDGTDTATFDVNLVEQEQVSVEVTDELGQKASNSTQIGFSVFIPKFQIPVDIQHNIPWHIQETIDFTVGEGKKVSWKGDILTGTGAIQFGNGALIKLIP
jgi:3',5'-cyclic AMP phosphodiesterase CpdA